MSKGIALGTDATNPTLIYSGIAVSLAKIDVDSASTGAAHLFINDPTKTTANEEQIPAGGSAPFQRGVSGITSIYGYTDAASACTVYLQKVKI